MSQSFNSWSPVGQQMGTNVSNVTDIVFEIYLKAIKDVNDRELMAKKWGIRTVL